MVLQERQPPARFDDFEDDFAPNEPSQQGIGSYAEKQRRAQQLGRSLDPEKVINSRFPYV